MPPRPYPAPTTWKKDGPTTPPVNQVPPTKYVRALIRAGEPHLRVANEALRTPTPDFTAPATLRLLFMATTEADSRLYDLLLQHRAAIVELEGEEAFQRQARSAVGATFDKALEYQSEDLMATAVAKLALLDRAEAKRLESQGSFALALAGNDRKALVKAHQKLP